MKQYGIYVLPDGQGRIVAINSEGLLTSLDGWIRIDEYESDEPYAQGDCLGGPLTDGRGVCRYKLEDGRVLERTQAEMDADDVPPVPQVSDTDIALAELAALAAENSLRLDEQDAALVELAALIAGR